ncbi:MAG: glycosyltransferase [Rectinemataceae bacterium]|nr:glycosyltransferase [Rectinemataceae bacterium]
MKVAIIHYWLVGMRGGERVLEALCRMYPDADIFTNVYIPKEITETIKSHKITTTFIQNLPRVATWYQRYLFLMPLALEQLDLRGYNLVISSESGPAKGVITDPDCLHVCYCHSPMRYLWDMYPGYLSGKDFITKNIMKLAFSYLRIWDVTSAARVDRIVANSSFVAQRIHKYWRRESVVIPPPVAVERFTVSRTSGDYYLWVGQLIRYKRPDLAIKAFTSSGRRLIVAGAGYEIESLKSIAGPSIEFVGHVTDAEVTTLLVGCKALVFPGVEDFGIVPVEAMASGKPVIAFRRGGALESVVERETGLFFNEATPEALNAVIDAFERDSSWVNPDVIREHAERFTEAVFRKSFADVVSGTDD